MMKSVYQKIRDARNDRTGCELTPGDVKELMLNAAGDVITDYALSDDEAYERALTAAGAPVRRPQ